MALDIPKRVWVLWSQGLDGAPPVPRACVDTWVRHNPDWEVNVLTGQSLCNWVDPVLCQPKARSLLPYRLSELVRLNLLARHGGVYVDATCYCMKPLETWLPDYLTSGFFAFARPAHDRLVSSWFLASPPGGYIPTRMWEELGRYYLGYKLFGPLDRNRVADIRWRRFARRQLNRTFNRNSRTTSLWFAPPLPQLGITPYMSFHYVFSRLTRRDPTFGDTWKRTVEASALGPASLLSHGLGEPPSPQILADIEQRRVPVYKLNWRVDPAALPPSSTLNVLLTSR